MKLPINQNIRIIITGGTFDKQYDEIKGALTFKNTHLPEILRVMRCTVTVEIELNQMIDSLDMHKENRLKILEACRMAAEKRIIITHGTDTMVESAEVLGAAGLKKTVVLTGAMVPYSMVGSDALFNLGCSFSAVQILPTGVYICMNGRVFPHNSVHKNRDKGIFEWTRPG